MADHNNRKKKDFPVTAVLAAVVLALAVCVVVLAWIVLGRGDKSQQDQTQVQQSQEASGEASGEAAKQDETEKTAQTEPESETAAPDETEKAAQTEAESETSKPEETETETEAETETQTEPETQPEEKLVVAIDPGHQGSWVNMSDTEPNGPGSSEMKAKASTGTQGPFSGKAEYELNLEISLLLRTELEARGYEVILTREDNDTAISNAERAQMAYEQGGDIYVRIHANGSDDSGVSGALVMVPSASNPYVGQLAPDSYLLADCILSAYCEKASFPSLGIQYYDNMTGINWSQLPVMILEMGFMTNQSDDLRMSDAAVQPLMAEGIADGIDRYFTEKGMKKKEASAQEKARLNGLLEQLGEDFVYPQQEAGETWAVSLADLNSGAQDSIGGEQKMKSASVIKVFIMAAIYDRVCYPASEERRISIEESYDGELKQLITDMITVSDNEAANTLIRRLGGGDAQAGMEVVNQFCRENGYVQTSLGRLFLEPNPSGDNFTSADDCRNLLASIYNGTCVGPEASAKMLEYLKNQTRTNKIPAGLAGTEAAAYNKTGELAGDYGDYVENDIAIVEDGTSAYVLCVLSGNLQDNGSAISRIGELSRTVYAQWKG